MYINDIFKNTELTLSQAVELYKELEESLTPESFDMLCTEMGDLDYDYFRHNNPPFSPLTNWGETANSMRFSLRFASLFPTEELILWVAYRSMEMLLDISGGTTCDLQKFGYRGTDYWVICRDNMLTFVLDSELKKGTA